MRSARDADIGVAIATGVAIVTGAVIVTGAAPAGMGAAGTDTGIGVLVGAGMYGAMAIGSASAADGE